MGIRIAYISAAILPSERANTIQVMKVCQAFARLGHDVTLFAPAASQTPPAWDSLADYYGLSTSFNIHYLPLSPYWNRRDITWKGVLAARRQGVDLVYTRILPPAVFALLINIPVILEMHQVPSGRFGPIWFRLFLKWPGRKRLAPITRSLKVALQEKYQPVLPEGQVVVAPSGVDLERYQDLPDSKKSRQILNLPKGFTVVCSGHIYRGRGMELFIKLAERMPDTNFLWAGGTPEDLEAWRSRIRSLGLKNLTLPGFIPNNQLPLYQAAADALLIPYEAGVTNSGGEITALVCSPMKVFEYMAADRPVLCSDLPVLHEVLDKKNAIFCPPGDVDAWQDALISLQTDPVKGQVLASQARLDVERFSWEERCRSLLSGFMEGVS